MISICIPTYNFNITKLVKDLLLQAETNAFVIEILVYDDESTENFKLKNRSISELTLVTYKELQHNIGRSAIRNLLAKNSQYEHILFIDCDSEINSNYLKNYAIHLGQHDLVCGGRLHPQKLPNPDYSLRWTYGKEREDLCAKQRTKGNKQAFISNNFLINKKLFNSIKFDENIIQYGHEDTIIGIEMDNIGVQIKHIDNPVIHIGLETNLHFIEKTKESLNTLTCLLKTHPKRNILYKKVTIAKYFNICQSMHVDSIIRYLFEKNKDLMENKLKSVNPSLLLFDLYKLGYLSTIYKKYQ